MPLRGVRRVFVCSAFVLTKVGRFRENVPTWIEFTLSSPAFFEQLVDQPHSCLRFSARSKLRDASLHSPRPIRFCCRARDVEAVFARQQIGDHDDGNPSVAFKKRFHDCRIKILFKIDLVDFWIVPREDRDLRQFESRLFRRSCWPLESLLPQSANRFVIVRRISRNGETFIFVSESDLFIMHFPLRNFESGHPE